MRYLLKLNMSEIIDGFVGNYLIPKSRAQDHYFKRIAKSIAGKFGYSLPRSIDFLLRMGERYSLKYTFFVVGKLAGDNPGLVATLLRHGHEIASHSLTHVLAVRLTRD